MTVPVGRLPLAEAWQHVADITRDELASGSRDRYRRIWANFERFADRVGGVDDAQLVDRQLVVAFLGALAVGQRPSPKTQSLRLDAIRRLFREFRKAGLVAHDPTLDVVVQTSTAPPVVALTDGEVNRCRWAAAVAIDAADRYSATWALLEAGLSTGETGMACWDDITIDETDGGVAIAVGSRHFGATVRPTAWGAGVLARVLRGDDLNQPVAVIRSTSYDSRRTSVTHVFREICHRAGITAQPRALTAWVARRAYLDTGHVENAALVVGYRSLDRTAELIGLDWRSAAE